MVLNEGTISAVNVSANTGGNIKLNTRTVQLNNGAITATSILGEGGDINLQVRDDLVLRNGSEISTRAGTQNTGGGNGGNITIDTGVLAIVENSQINANAFAGKGGNIGITTRGIFVSPDSSIMASSTLGFNGVIEINNLNVDPSRGLAKLPENVSDPSNQVSTGCAADRGNQFVITGQGGLPEDPSQTLLGRTIWQDLRLTTESSGEQGRISRSQPITKNQQLTPLVEATQWMINSKGQVELVAQSPEATLNGLGQKSVGCPRTNFN